jgi:hypothetical protein
MKIEIGLGGVLNIPGDSGYGREKVVKCREDLNMILPGCCFDYLEGIPDSEDLAHWAEDMGFPYRVFTALYVPGGFGGHPDGLEVLKKNLEICERYSTITTLNMQVLGSSESPSMEELYDFYEKADAMAGAQGVLLTTETHIDRFTYDPSYALVVQEYLQRESGGDLGLNIWADFSHYVHQMENEACMKAHPAFTVDHKPGRAGFEAVVDELIRSGLIVGGHLRCAAPNSLGREKGAIQYPIVAPSSDPYSDATDELIHHGTWREERTHTWKNLYRSLFVHAGKSASDGTLRFSSEFIRCEDEYNMDGYTNYWQNLNVIAWAKSALNDVNKSCV